MLCAPGIPTCEQREGRRQTQQERLGRRHSPPSTPSPTDAPKEIPEAQPRDEDEGDRGNIQSPYNHPAALTYGVKSQEELEKSLPRHVHLNSRGTGG